MDTRGQKINSRTPKSFLQETLPEAKNGDFVKDILKNTDFARNMQKWFKTRDLETVVSEETGGGGALYTASAAGCSRPCGARNITSHHIVRSTVADR